MRTIIQPFLLAAGTRCTKFQAARENKERSKTTGFWGLARMRGPMLPASLTRAYTLDECFGWSERASGWLGR